MPCASRVRTRPWTVEGARSMAVAISPRLIRRPPCSTVRMRSARSTAWIIRPPSAEIGPCDDRSISVWSRSHSTLSNAIRDSRQPHGSRLRPRSQENVMDEPSLTQKLAAEAFGTAFLVFIGVGSVPATIIVHGDAPFTMADLGMISFAFATVVVATIYALGHISGNHINPAVTLGLAVTGKFPWSRVPAYIAAQVVGAIVGAAAIIGVLGTAARDAGLGVATYSGDVSALQAFFAEFVGTFILVFTVFGVIHRKASVGFAGVAIGLVVFAAIIPVAPTTGASINPARTFGPMLVQQIAGGSVSWSQLPVYLAAEFLAGALAALAYVAISRTRADATPAPSLTETAVPTTQNTAA